MSQGVPRSLIVFGVVAVAGFELIRAFPDLLLIPQQLAGKTGEYEGKAQQGGFVAAQTAKTVAEVQLAKTQTAKMAAETELAKTQAQLNKAQAELAQSKKTGTDIDNVAGAISVAVLGAAILGAKEIYDNAAEKKKTVEAEPPTPPYGSQNLAAWPSTPQQTQAPQSTQQVRVPRSIHEAQANQDLHDWQSTLEPPRRRVRRYATVTAPRLNLRSGPSVTYESLLTMPQGTRVTVVREVDDDWLEIDAIGQDGEPIHGFANGKLLSMAQ
jgi:uncharacterized protein YgiM (DUF1202 family)